MEITFENLPKAVSNLTQELSEIKRLLLAQNSPSSGSQDELLTIQQAGELLSLSVPTLYGYVQRKEIPVSKRGKRLYFSKLELTEWVKNGRIRTTSELGSEAIHQFTAKSL